MIRITRSDSTRNARKTKNFFAATDVRVRGSYALFPQRFDAIINVLIELTMTAAIARRVKSVPHGSIRAAPAVAAPPARNVRKSRVLPRFRALPVESGVSIRDATSKGLVVNAAAANE